MNLPAAQSDFMHSSALLQLNTLASFDLGYLNTVFLPLLGLSLGFSMLTVRPYHRCVVGGGV